jgi:pyridoxine 5-phosphate synthase
MTSSPRLSVNINKVALLRNSRGGSLPDLFQVAKDCEAFGAEGITIHPRQDQRHIRYTDIGPLKEIVTTELNIEGNPTDEFIELVLKYHPEQCTLVPDTPNQLTSDSGWDTIKEQSFLVDVINTLKARNIRVALFIDPVKQMIEGAKKAGADRVELYTGPYAAEFEKNREQAVQPHHDVAMVAIELGIGLNAGHDLNLQNLRYYTEAVPNLLEVSIGHALISDALYYGLSNTIAMYRYQLRPAN